MTGGVCYVCPDEDARERIKKHAADVGLFDGGGLRLELLESVKGQALAGYEVVRSERLSRPSAAPPPMLAVNGG